MVEKNENCNVSATIRVLVSGDLFWEFSDRKENRKKINQSIDRTFSIKIPNNILNYHFDFWRIFEGFLKDFWRIFEGLSSKIGRECREQIKWSRVKGETLHTARTAAWKAPKTPAAPPQSRFMPHMSVFGVLMQSPPVSKTIPFPTQAIFFSFFPSLSFGLWLSTTKYGGSTEAFPTLYSAPKPRSRSSSPLIIIMSAPTSWATCWASLEIEEKSTIIQLNQSINQSKNQSINQSINPSTNQPIHRPINQPINQSIEQTVVRTVPDKLCGVHHVAWHVDNACRETNSVGQISNRVEGLAWNGPVHGKILGGGNVWDDDKLHDHSAFLGVGADALVGRGGKKVLPVLDGFHGEHGPGFGGVEGKGAGHRASQTEDVLWKADNL